MDTAAVLDYGSRTFRAGYCYSFPSDEEPRVVTPCAVQVQEPPDQQQQQPDQQQQAADRAHSHAAATTSGAQQHPPQEQQGSSPIIYPVQRGKVAHPEGLEVLLHSAMYELLGWEPDQEGGILIAEPLFVSRRERELMAQLMFEHFNVNGLFFQDQATLALYALGLLSGTVIDIGHGKVDVSVVSEGQVVYATARRLPFAGIDITQYVIDLLKSRGLPGEYDAQTLYEAAESLKEQCAIAAESAEEFARLSRGEEPKNSEQNGNTASTSQAHATSNGAVPQDQSGPGSSGKGGEGAGKGAAKASESSSRPAVFTHTMPDGQKLKLDAREGYKLAEVFLDPSVLGFDSPGLPELAMEAATSSYDPVHRRAGHLTDVLICGGGSLIPNLPQRIIKEMRALAPFNVPEPALITMPEYLQGPHTCLHAAWIGGSVLARSLSHQGLLVNKGEYDEYGPVSVHRKCM